MKYQLKPGVVMFSMCNAWFLFPSRNSKDTIPLLISLPDNLMTLLAKEKEEEKEQKTIIELTADERKKLDRLVKMNYIEELLG